MAAWDRRSAGALRSQQEAALRRQVLDAVAPFSPFWQQRLEDLGRRPADVATPAGLQALPAVGQRDVCPNGDPAGAASLVLQSGESGFAQHAAGPALRRALLRRWTSPRSYRALVEQDTRATSYVYAGQGTRFPVASTRNDLDVVARTGARLWQVLGLSTRDVVVSALRADATALQQGLWLAALAAGSPLLSPGSRIDPLTATLRAVAPSVLVLPAATAASLLDALDGVDLSSLTTVLLAGAPYGDERDAVAERLRSRARSAVVLAIHVADGHRVLWGECRESAGRTGLHTYPDVDLVQLVDVETGEDAGGAPGELVLTQLGLRGSALLRWRTGDLAEQVSTGACTACGRTVPRVVGVQRQALVPVLELVDGERAVDLRAVASALAGRPELADWRIQLARSERADTDQLLVHLGMEHRSRAGAVARQVARDVELAAGVVPTQIVVNRPGRLPSGDGPSPRILT